MNGDGRLDIIAADYGDGAANTPTEVRLYDYNLGAPVLEWTVPITPAIRTGGLNGLLGSHAVGDIDGQQPGGDLGPEIVISHNGKVTVLDADGSTVWSVASWSRATRAASASPTSTATAKSRSSPA